MEKYLGNKKSIVEGIEEYINSKESKKGVFIDVFTGTTNVAQYFKQKGYNIISNDINEFSYILQNSYIKNNSFPKFLNLLTDKLDYDVDYEKTEKIMSDIILKIKRDKNFDDDYIDRTNYIEEILPLVKVIMYLNSLSVEETTVEDEYFYDYYSKEGKKSEYKSIRGTRGNRNYFSSNNAKKIGLILNQIKRWRNESKINMMEYYILLTSVIEEVNLVSNVSGTFHDFNRTKLFPNAIVELELKPPILNISSKDNFQGSVFCCDSNELYKKEEFKSIKEKDILYMDPPYNFRQYSSYYHLLNFISIYADIEDLKEYLDNIEFVRGQNMNYNFESDFCYKDKFQKSMESLIESINSMHVFISYMDVNNHWSKESKSNKKGRQIIKEILSNQEIFSEYDEEPFLIDRLNYQSQKGLRKRNVKELVFWGRRKI